MGALGRRSGGLERGSPRAQVLAGVERERGKFGTRERRGLGLFLWVGEGEWVAGEVMLVRAGAGRGTGSVAGAGSGGAAQCGGRRRR